MAMILREVISSIRKSIREVNADSKLTNKYVYSKLLSKSNLIIQRESDALRIASTQGMYQSLKCVEVKEVPAIDPNCYITSETIMYRTKGKLPDVYFDSDGPILRSVLSVDRSHKIYLTNQESIRRTLEDSNSKYDTDVYAFYESGYLYITKRVPLFIEGFFVSDVSNWCGCECKEEDKECVRLLDTQWFIPTKLQDAVISSVLQELTQVYEQIPEKIMNDKNPNQ